MASRVLRCGRPTFAVSTQCASSLSGVSLEKRDHAQLAVRAILPACVTELACELPNLSPIPFSGQDVPFEVDVALYCEAAESQPAILLSKRAVQVGGDLLGDLG